MRAQGLSIGLVGPLPPPAGGMANQTRQLAQLLRQEGAEVQVVQVNAAYRPAWLGKIKIIRAFARLIPYLFSLWQTAGRVQLIHVMANSGWSWHLYAAPAVWIAKLRGVPVIINYRGGGAAEFFERSFFWVKPTLRRADAVIVPSAFLQQVFAKWGTVAQIVPNIIDLARFQARQKIPSGEKHAHIVVTRNLEPIYDIGTALYAFSLVSEQIPAARLTIAGSGPELDNLTALARSLAIAGSVTFTGRLDNEAVAALYQQADVTVNPSLVDNMPISVLESLASGVPVVSTDVGGVPFLVEHDKTALLVPPGNPQAMAAAITRLLSDDNKAQQLTEAGLLLAQNYAWPNVRQKLLDVYSGVITNTQNHIAVEMK